MKLYKVSQTVRRHYDTYASAIVAAKDEEEAKTIHPGGPIYHDRWENSGYAAKFDNWCALTDVEVEYIGEAKEKTRKGVILAAFDVG
jgi:hypothetical protein